MSYLKVILPLVVLAALLFFRDDILKELGDSMVGDSAIERSGSYPEYALVNEVTLAQGTLLEFGARSCIACRRMEEVLQELEGKFPSGLAIERVIITTDEGLNKMKRFGVLMIPTQLILDKQGAEVYRHTGFISTKDLSEIINKQLNIIN